jgi:arylsulfatase A-like enzyme
VPLPAGYPERAPDRERILDGKPRHWRMWYDGELVSNYEAPAAWVPATLTSDQVREVNARNAIECELIDEAIGRVLRRIDERGWGDDVDVVFSTDHGELQGDFGLLFKGPYHVDALMRLPLIWRPAPSARVAPAVVSRPVGLVDLAPTFCAIAGLPAASWMQGNALPVDDRDADARGFERVLTEWDSELFGVGVHLRTITRAGWTLTRYLPGTVHDGSEGELYDSAADPLQQRNLWNDPSYAGIRDDLLGDLLDHEPPTRQPKLELEAPV